MPHFPSTSNTTCNLRPATFSFFSEKMAKLKEGNRLIPLHLGDSYLLPPEPARKISLEEVAVHRYCDTAGLAELRQATEDYLKSYYGVNLDEKQIYITPGATGALSLAVEAALDPGEEVIVLTPSWPLIFGILQRRGINVVEVAVGDKGVPSHPEEFARRLQAAITPKTTAIYYCDPNNPAGFIYPETYLDIITRLVKEHNLWLLSDIVYGELAFSENFYPAFSRAPLSSHCLTAGSFSKTYALAGHRVGYLLVPGELDLKIQPLLTHSTYHASTSAQQMALACLLEIEKERQIWLSYRQGAKITQQLLEAPFAMPEAGGFVFIDLRPLGITDEEQTYQFLHRCLDKGVALCPGSVFGKDFACFVRLCYTAVSPEELERGIAILNQIIKEQ